MRSPRKTRKQRKSPSDSKRLADKDSQRTGKVPQRTGLPIGLPVGLLLITVVALILRVESLNSASLFHHDEGVYVASGVLVASGQPLDAQFPLPAYAPPLFPLLVAGVMTCMDLAWPTLGIYVSVFLGTATVPLFFLLARRLVGDVWGLIAGGALAASDLHVAYSRVALTDAPVLFWFVLAMYCVVRVYESLGAETPPAIGERDRRLGERRAAIGWALAAGLATGAAMNTKYSGWLPLAIGLAATSVSIARIMIWKTQSEEMPGEPARLRRLFCLLLFSVAVAAVCYAPWVWHVQSSFDGGYRAVVLHHASYSRGWFSWPQNAWQLILSITAFRHFGWILTLAAGLIGLAGFARFAQHSASPTSASDSAPLSSPSNTSSNSPLNGRTAISLIGFPVALAAGVATGADLVWFALAAVGLLPFLLFGAWKQTLVAVWVASLLVLVPLYHPYVRLLVPLAPGAICLALMVVSHVLPMSNNLGGGVRQPLRVSPTWMQGGILIASLTLVLIAAVGHPFGLWPTPGVWSRWSGAGGYEQFAAELPDRTAASSVVICAGPPALVLYCSTQHPAIGLRSQDYRDVVRSLPDDRPAYLAVDSHWLGEDDKGLARESIQQTMPELAFVFETDYSTNIVTLLNQFTPRQVARLLRDGSQSATSTDSSATEPAFHRNTITLYRIGSRAEPALSK